MRTSHIAMEAESAFRQFVLDADFPCLGAKAAFNSNAETVRVFGELASAESTECLAASLSEFVQNPPEYATFVAIFESPHETTEMEFERLIWQQLRQLHAEDAHRADWASDVSSDPADPHFSFSFGGHALYVIGMHENSSRVARRFPWPAMIFNPHEQFERLRSDGKWKHMQETIRQRDMQLQGSVNPMLSDFGEHSEARQYSGRVVEENWRAPFQATNPGKCPFQH